MSWPPLETLKAFVTYGIASFIVIAGMGAIFALRGSAEASDTVAIIAGFVGSAVTFLFNQEVQTRTARQSQTATAQGATALATNGHATSPIDETPPKA